MAKNGKKWQKNGKKWPKMANKEFQNMSVNIQIRPSARASRRLAVGQPNLLVVIMVIMVRGKLMVLTEGKSHTIGINSANSIYCNIEVQIVLMILMVIMV